MLTVWKGSDKEFETMEKLQGRVEEPYGPVSLSIERLSQWMHTNPGLHDNSCCADWKPFIDADTFSMLLISRRS